RDQTDRYVLTPTINSGVQSVSFSAYRTSSSGSSLQVNYSTDNGATWQAAIESPYNLNTTKTSFTATINTTTSTIIQFRRTGGTVRLDDIEVTCPTSCTPTHSITNFAPTTGPVG